MGKDLGSRIWDLGSFHPNPESKVLNPRRLLKGGHATKGTKAQSRSKPAITKFYTFVLLRVFVPLWLFQHPARS